MLRTCNAAALATWVMLAILGLHGIATGANLLFAPIEGPSAWIGRDLQASNWWNHSLTPDDVNDLLEAVRKAQAASSYNLLAEGVPADIELESFPLGPPMLQKLDDIQHELEHGKGIVMIRNLPVKNTQLTEEGLAVLLMGISKHIGHVVLQSSYSRSVSKGHGRPFATVRAEMSAAALGSVKGDAVGKQTNTHYRFHTDRCDVLALMSVRSASQGGQSRLCSAPAIYNAMIQRNPDLAESLFDPLDRVWEGEKGFYTLPVWNFTAQGQFMTMLDASYTEKALYIPEAKGATQKQLQAIDEIEKLGLELGVEFVMQPGMLVLINNHAVYHGRVGNWDISEQDDNHSWDTTQGRLLMRTWISPYNSRALPDTPEYRLVWGSVEAGASRGGFPPVARSGEVPAPKFPDNYTLIDAVYNKQVQEMSESTSCRFTWKDA